MPIWFLFQGSKDKEEIDATIFNIPVKKVQEKQPQESNNAPDDNDKVGQIPLGMFDTDPTTEIVLETLATNVTGTSPIKKSTATSTPP